MDKTKIRKLIYHIKHRYATMNNVVVAIAVVIAASWAWGSISMMQRNFALQKDIDAKQRELQLTELEVQTLQFEQNYYQSNEYKDLAARERLGLAAAGEKVLILPPNSATAKANGEPAPKPSRQVLGVSNFQQWMNFLSGKSAAQLQK